VGSLGVYQSILAGRGMRASSPRSLKTVAHLEHIGEIELSIWRDIVLVFPSEKAPRKHLLGEPNSKFPASEKKPSVVVSKRVVDQGLLLECHRAHLEFAIGDKYGPFLEERLLNWLRGV